MTSVLKYFLSITLLVSLGGLSSGQLSAQKKPAPAEPVSLGKEGRLIYAADSIGNRIPDFSFAGYKAGDEAIPEVEARVFVPYKAGDATLRIQAAIDYIEALPVNDKGFRGAVLLGPGVFEVAGLLSINSSGVVLRGSGTKENGTVLLGTGTSRATLITVSGKNDKKLSPEVKVASAYVPVGAMDFQVSNPGQFKVGDLVQVRRPSTKEWIDKIGSYHFGGGETYLGWKPGQRDIFWDRQIKSVEGNNITLDIALTTALDSAFGGGLIASYQWPGRISNIGIENIALRSSYNEKNSKDEDHRWTAISLDNVTDAWVRQIEFKHFAGSAVLVQETAKRITVEDCKSLQPISEIGGQRRYTFLTNGQQTLFQRLYAENGYHDFAVGFCAPGPNVFVQCESHLPYSFSGAIDSWASGILFDKVLIDGGALSYMNRGLGGQGAGWTAAHSVFWQCSASRVENYAPPTAQNWAFGTWAQFYGDGYWAMSNEHIRPNSLYYAQLKDRIGSKAEARTQLLQVETEASSSPPVDVAMDLTAKAAVAAPLLSDFIDQASTRNSISISSKGLKTIDQIGFRKPAESLSACEFKILNGVLVRGDKFVTGKRNNVQWWSGSSRRYGVAGARPHITRFVPGKTGKGLTDDLDAMTDSMKLTNVIAIDHNYGLWYDRRRDDHERIRRMDGEVWPPFYEQPFARSGQGTAWDGLSKYDLTTYNNWYWDRLKTFADLADQKGLVLIHENYFQHNIIEAGAHYADFPWRPANNINNTGFPEPVPYAGDKRIFMAEQFYDISHPVRRMLHKAYIKKCLDNFAANSGVIQLIGEEFTGPLHFVQFWLDTVKEWEKETGKNAIIGLSVTKDVQDAILADKTRALIVDLIDIKYWHYQTGGGTYEPKGGQNLSPRQHARLIKSKSSSFEEVYKAVSEYRQRFPDKAVTYAASGLDSNGWAVLMAGGSLPAINLAPAEILKELAAMKVMQIHGNPAKQYMLANGAKSFLIYNASSEATKLDFSKLNGTYKVSYIDPGTGAEKKKSETLKTGNIVTINKSSSAAEVIWITKK